MILEKRTARLIKAFYFLCLILFSPFFPIGILSSRLPRRSFSLLQIVVGQLLFGYTSDRWSRKNSLMVVSNQVLCRAPTPPSPSFCFIFKTASLLLSLFPSLLNSSFPCYCLCTILHPFTSLLVIHLCFSTISPLHVIINSSPSSALIRSDPL